MFTFYYSRLLRRSSSRVHQDADTRRKPRVPRRARLEVECLETRINPNTTLNLVSGGLQIVVAGPDTVNLSTASGKLVVADTSAGQVITDTTAKFTVAGAAGSQTATENGNLAGDFTSITITGTGGGQTVNFLGGLFIATNINDGTIPTVGFATAASSFGGDLNVQTASLVQGAAIAGTGAINITLTGTNTPLQVNANLTSSNGPVALQTTGDLVVGAGVTVSSGTGALSLGADLTVAGMGDDGVGTLTINPAASVYGAKISLRGADEEIANTASVGSAVTTASVATKASATLTGLAGPQGLAFDGAGNLFVANSNGSTVSKFAPGATTATATLTGLSEPTALLFDGRGNLYVANFSSNTVSRFTPGATTPTATLTGLSGPAAMAFDASGNLYVANYNSGTVSEFAPGATTAGTTISGLDGPQALAFDGSGNLYVANYLGNSVMEFASGMFSMPSDTISGMSGPSALVFDPQGDLYVTNYLGSSVAEFSASTLSMGMVGMPSATLTGLSGPSALSFDNAANLYVANYNNNTVSEFAPATTMASATLTGLSFPDALAFDAGGNLYVANSNIGTISKFPLIGHAATTALNIQSSLGSRPMSLGGTNDAAVAGVNLTSSELARLATAASGTTTFGGSGQTGDILVTTATLATTASAFSAIVQTGAGQILLDDGGSATPALNGAGGNVSLTSGTGGIVAKATNLAGTPDIGNTASVNLTSSGSIGSASQLLQLGATNLATNTAANNGNEFLTALGTIKAFSLNAGSGTITLSGSNTFQVAAANGLASTSSLTINAPTIVDLNGTAQTVAGLNGGGVITNNGMNNTATLAVTGGGLFAGAIEDGGSSSTTALVVNGSGKTLILTGTSSYTGSTSIVAGTLQVDGSIGSAVSIGGGLLSGNGTVGNVTLVSGALQPGDSPGTLHTGNLTLAAGSTFIAQLGGTTAGTGYSQDAANGMINLGGATLNLQFLNGFVAAAGQTFVLIANSGTSPVAGTFAGMPEGAPLSVGGQLFHITYAGGHGFDVVLIASATAVNHFVVTPEIASTVSAGDAFLVMVQAVDPFGNPISNYSGPATATATISPPSSASNFPTTVSVNNGLGFFLAKLQKTGTYTITVASGGWTGSSSPVTVQAGSAFQLAFGTQPGGAPTGTALPPVTVQVRDQFGNVVTTDNTDQVTLAVASGPGPFTAGSTTSAMVQNGVATFSNLALVNPGSYTLSEVVPGLYTGPNSASFTVGPLQVVSGSFASAPWGFSVQFNAPYLVNSTTPVLFGRGLGAAAPFPSVTLTQTLDSKHNPVNNAIAGTLVLNTTTDSLTFVATTTTLENNNGSPVLADGTYVVDLASSAAHDGFQALNSGGGFLDGRGTGIAGSGDFTATFTVNVAAAHEDVVWVPATADGPGQALSGPGMNQAGSGYPIYLNDSTGGVKNVQVTLNYDPTLLTVTGATGPGFTLLGTSTPGHALLQYSGPPLPMGLPAPIGFVQATVAGGTAASPTPYRAKDLLHLSNVLINSGAVQAVTADAVHLVAYVGDADGNGAYSSNDAVLITRVTLQADSGFPAYPLVDPTIVADTDGSGFIPADAALQANEASVGFPTANLADPPIPAGVVFQPVANNVDPALSIPSHLHVGANGTVTVPVMIDDAHPAGSTGLIEAHLALTFDPTAFTVSAADIHLGSLLAASDGWSLTSTINAVTGQIAIALSSTTPIATSQGGSLVTIDFHQRPGEPGALAPGGANAQIPPGTNAPGSPVALVPSVNPTGNQVVLTELEDAQGTFTLSPTDAIARVMAGLVIDLLPSSLDRLNWEGLSSRVWEGI